MSRSPQSVDPRSLRTREALHSAFVLMALDRRYHEIRIDDILKASGVSRSTFYEHFVSKDALLVSSMDGPLSLLAGMPVGESDIGQVGVLLEHFWERRALARSIFQGAPFRVIRNALVMRIEARLKRHDGGKPGLPRRLAAHALADGMFSPIVAWLAGEASCAPVDLAAALMASSKAMLAGMSAATK